MGSRRNKRLIRWLYKTLLRPALEQYVKSTDNPYDDAALDVCDAVFMELEGE